MALRRTDILMIVNVLTEMEWTLVNMVNSDEALKNVFLVQANWLKVCVDSIIVHWLDSIKNIPMKKLLGDIACLL